jgi:hypothetical protein
VTRHSDLRSRTPLQLYYVLNLATEPLSYGREYETRPVLDGERDLTDELDPHYPPDHLDLGQHGMGIPMEYVLLTLTIPDDLSKLALLLAFCKESHRQCLFDEDIRILASLKYLHKFLMVKDYSEPTSPLPFLELDVGELFESFIEEDLNEL